jgi:hypothetical protein
MHINIQAHMTEIGWSARMFIAESEELVTTKVVNKVCNPPATEA